MRRSRSKNLSEKSFASFQTTLTSRKLTQWRGVFVFRPEAKEADHDDHLRIRVQRGAHPLSRIPSIAKLALAMHRSFKAGSGLSATSLGAMAQMLTYQPSIPKDQRIPITHHLTCTGTRHLPPSACVLPLVIE